LHNIHETDEATFRSIQSENDKLVHENANLEAENGKLGRKADLYDSLMSGHLVATYPNPPLTAPILSASHLLPTNVEDFVVSELLKARPLKTTIWLASSQPDAMALAQQIYGIFLRGGFPVSPVARDDTVVNRIFTGQMVTTNGIEVLTDEIAEPALRAALDRLTAATGSFGGLWAGHSYPPVSPVVIVIRDQP
jgi:hypothetical protein